MKSNQIVNGEPALSRSDLTIAQTFPLLLSKRWRWPTVVVVLGMLFLVRLGFWQLDRLEQRRSDNAATLAELQAEPLMLNELADLEALDQYIARRVTVEGVYDNEAALVNRFQSYNGQSGVHLIVPLQLSGSQGVILVNRGWLPQDETDLGAFAYEGAVAVAGYLQPSAKPLRATVDSYDNSPDSPIRAWDFLFLDAIERQLPYKIAPAYLQISPPYGQTLPPDTSLPIPQIPTFDLSEGNHLSYAIQWFLFALILAVVYVLAVRRRVMRAGPDRPMAGV